VGGGELRSDCGRPTRRKRGDGLYDPLVFRDDVADPAEGLVVEKSDDLRQVGYLNVAERRDVEDVRGAFAGGTSRGVPAGGMGVVFFRVDDNEL
jgi:hypothetical protein